MTDLTRMRLDLRDISREDFEDLIHQLLLSRYPQAGIRKVDGAGGDGGIDSYSGDLTTGPAIWQCKRFTGRIKSVQKKQIIDSVKAATQAGPVAEWTLCLNVDLTKKENLWFQTVVVPLLPTLCVTALWTSSDIIKMLLSRQRIRDAFFPNTALSNNINIQSLFTNSSKQSLNDELDRMRSMSQVFQDKVQSLDPRFETELVTGKLAARHERPPNLVMRVERPDATVSFFASDPNDYQKNPLSWNVGFSSTGIQRLQIATLTGTEVRIEPKDILDFGTTSPLLKELLGDVDLSAIGVTINPGVNQPTANALLLDLRTGFGGRTAMLEKVPFFVQEVLESSIRYSTRDYPCLKLDLDLPLVGAKQGGEIRLELALVGANVKDALRTIEFLRLMGSASLLDVLPFQSPNPLLRVPMNNLPEVISERSYTLLRSLLNVSMRCGAELLVPGKLTADDVDTIRRMDAILSGKLRNKAVLTITLMKLYREVDASTKDFMLGQNQSMFFEHKKEQYQLFEKLYTFHDVRFETNSYQILEPQKAFQRYENARIGDEITIEVEVDQSGNYRYRTVDLLGV